MGCTSYDALYCRVGEAFTDSPVVLSYYRHLIVQMQNSCLGPVTFLKKKNDTSDVSENTVGKIR
jgi:hypothetical protein